MKVGKSYRFHWGTLIAEISGKVRKRGSPVTTDASRQSAKEWLAATISQHLHPALGNRQSIARAAATAEQVAFEAGMPIEQAAALAVAWAEDRNEEAGLTQ
jgi:hypothetical protein